MKTIRLGNGNNVQQKDGSATFNQRTYDSVVCQETFVHIQTWITNSAVKAVENLMNDRSSSHLTVLRGPGSRCQENIPALNVRRGL